MTRILPEPSSATDPSELFLDYLDFYRATIEAKLVDLPERDLRSSRLPSGWAPIELLKHLVAMERRWLVWGFAAEPLAEPWDDHGADHRWQVREDESLASLSTALHRGGERTRSIVESTSLAHAGGIGGRFGPETTPPTLIWILFHVLQEYARHAGHLDIVRELMDGSIGE